MQRPVTRSWNRYPNNLMARRNPIATLLIGLIKVYRYTLSYVLGRQCRHLPTCSAYAIDAIEMHGALAGFWLALSRICRCHPWGSHGLDPVPEKLDKRYGFWQGWRYGRWSPKRSMALADQETAQLRTDTDA